MNCPLPRYYFCHAVISLVIAFAVAPLLGLKAGFAAGAMFYAGREYTQWEAGAPFDWRGLVAPVLTCFLGLALAGFFAWL